MNNGFAAVRTFAARTLFFGMLSLFSALGARAEGPLPEEGYNVLIEGKLPQAARLHVQIDGSKEEALRIPVGEGKVLAGFRVPPGKPVLLYLLAEDSDGVPRFEGKAEILMKEGVQAPQVVKLESLMGDAPAELTFASHRLVLEFAGIGDSKNLSTRVTARLFDADGAIVAIKPDDVKWEINDPWIRENMMPCKGANGPPPACIEFGPIARRYTDVTACFQGWICPINPTPAPNVWRMVSAGLGEHACALKMDGTAYCWGQGGHGELGVDVPRDCIQTFNDDRGGAGTRPWGCSSIPVQVRCAGGPCNFVDISAGQEHTCAVDNLGQAWCWGGNYMGEIGIGTDDEDGIGDPQPQKVLGMHEFTAISAGVHFTCGLTTGHDVYCWGYNRIAVVPHVPDTIVREPMNVNLPFDALSIDAGWDHVCARTVNGMLFCWGTNSPVFHPLGNDQYNSAPQCDYCPVFPRLMQFGQISGLGMNDDIDLASAGMSGTCAHITMGSRTLCWGAAVPPTTTTGPVDRLSRGGQIYCSLRGTAATCAGQGKMGALGDGSFAYDPAGRGPVSPVGPPFKIREISAGLNFTCAIGKDDRVYCWGNNHLGKLGNGMAEIESAVPVRVSVN